MNETATPEWWREHYAGGEEIAVSSDDTPQGTHEAAATAVYDNDPGKVGRRISGLEIYDIVDMLERNREMRIEIGIIATPAEAAQEVAEIMVRAGVRSILNFAPIRLEVPADITVRNVDVTLELQVVSYLRADKDRSRR